ncbi:MAG: ERF family protein [Pseudomonadota bacterium]|nr:ERF family protein [Pseudomonadota bacterium]
MKTSESIIKFAPAFVKAQAEISGASKDKANPAFKSKYADLQSVTDAIRPAAAAHGLAYFQDATMTEDSKLLLITRVIHESGEWVEYEMRMPIAKLDPQGFGSAMTYARRYSLSAAFGVAPEDDDGNAASGVQAKPAPYNTTPARVATPPVVAKPATPAATTPPANLADMVMNGETAAKAGLPAYEKFWKSLTVVEKNALGVPQHDKWKALASLAKVAA